MLHRAGLLALEVVRREATGVSLCMGVQERLGTEQELTELGDPCQ